MGRESKRCSRLSALPSVRRQAARQQSGLSSAKKSHSFFISAETKTQPPASAGGSRSVPPPRWQAGRQAGRPWGAAARARWGGARPRAVPPLPPQERLWGRTGCVCVSGCEFKQRAAMRRWRLLLLPALLAGLVSVRGQDDFLGDALLEENTKKPPVTQKTPSSDADDFDLSDALDFGDSKPHPPANPRDTDNPKQDQPKGSDKFDDSDLWDGSSPRGGSDGSGSNERKGPTPKTGQDEEASQGAIAGIISAVGATVVASVASFIAYQKKKLCFKQSADEENVNMDSYRGAQSEPPVQRTLLEN
ncbi:CD99 antigen [Taeniopygia guttata]|uniref:CD99 antigen n=1 Tax=Taeniopygia guttata TaxID=59729 RepID=UPI003BB9173A